MQTVSLCMIVKNEEKVLARCLESVRDFADERGCGQNLGLCR